MVAEVVNIAEHSTYLELTSRVCYYDAPNLNNDMLPYDETSETKAQTLVHMPVQAKYKLSPDGKPTFGSHQMVRKKDGTVEFGTSSIGVNVKVYIQEDNVDLNGTIKTLPCLFSVYRIWKRYKNVIAAVQRLYSENKLYSSWEINTYQYLYDNGIRKVIDYEFLSNCLLGYEYTHPAYGTNANAISMAEHIDNSQLMIAEALSQDLIEENYKEGIAEMKTENKPVEAENTKISEQPDTKQENAEAVDSAQLTYGDLRSKVSQACNNKLGQWCYIAFFFPNEKTVWCEYDGAESELDFVKFTYEVDAEENVTVSEPEYVKLTVSIAEVNDKIAEMQKEIDIIKADIGHKNNAIIQANSKIQELNIQISELTPYKEKVEAAEKEKIETEIAKEKAELRARLLTNNLFTEAEVEEQHIKDLIEARDVSTINGLIADRFVASFDVQTKENSAKAEIEDIATASLNTDEEYTSASALIKQVLSH